MASAFQPGVVTEVLPGVRRVTAPNPGPMTGPGTNTYLIGDEKVAVIDTGMAEPAHLDAIEAGAPGPIEWILVTHAHPDHSVGARQLAERTGAPVYAHPTPLRGIRDRDFRADRYLDEADVLRGPDFTLRCLHTPGHAADHLCFLLEEQGLLIAGDHVMEAVTVVIAPPDGDMAAYLDSLRRLQTEPVEIIAPAHGDLMRQPDAVFEYIIQHRLERERQVFDLLGDRGRRIDDLVPEIYTDIPEQLHPVAAWQVYAHLLKLRAEGRVEGDDLESRWRQC